MTAPVRNSIELNTVGELHLVLLVEPPLLFFPPGSLSLFARGGLWIFVEFDVVAKGANDAFSLVTPPSVVELDQGSLPGEASVTGRGGMGGCA